MLPFVPKERQGLHGRDSRRPRTTSQAACSPAWKSCMNSSQAASGCNLWTECAQVHAGPCWQPPWKKNLQARLGRNSDPRPCACQRPRVSLHVLNSVQGERLGGLREELRNSVRGRTLDEHLHHEPCDELSAWMSWSAHPIPHSSAKRPSHFFGTSEKCAKPFKRLIRVVKRCRWRARN